MKAYDWMIKPRLPQKIMHHAKETTEFNDIATPTLTWSPSLVKAFIDEVNIVGRKRNEEGKGGHIEWIQANSL